jgi:dTDP-4-dehydrorhamnose 3,5-epimerase
MIDGVRLRELEPHGDDRGTFLELHRLEWDSGVEPVQWNAVRSGAGVLRGVHCHWRHDDYLVLLEGAASVGLCDLRPDSPTHRRSACLRLAGGMPQAITIPTGVAHGFYYHEPSIHLYAVSHYWSLDDELGCRWDDPALGIAWPQRTAHVSARDAELPSLAELERRLPLSRPAARAGSASPR